MTPSGVVFLNKGDTDISSEMVSENMEAIRRFSGIQVAGVINRISDFSSPEEKYDEILEPFLRNEAHS
jgi:hypothetical protein